MKNYGASATGVEAILQTNNTYITMHNSISSIGDIASGDTANNAADPFIIEAASGTPQGTIADFTIIANSVGGYSDTSYFSICIGKYHYLVWDPSPDHSSGPVINSTLQSLGYNGVYSQTLPTTELDKYIAIFVSVGIYADNYTIQSGSVEANALINFLNNGGRMYLEGGDIWYYDPLYGGYDFGTLFSINATNDGTSDLNSVLGQSGTFTNGMSFSYSGENSYIDHISPQGSASLILRNSSPGYDCGVAYDAGTHRTVGTSFEFAGLVDGSPPSTKEALANSIMQFFGISVGVKEEQIGGLNLPKFYSLSQNYPNPFSEKTIFKYALPKASHVNISLYDVTGRCIKRLVNTNQEPGYYTLKINGTELKTGIYFIRLNSRDFSISRKCMVIK